MATDVNNSSIDNGKMDIDEGIVQNERVWTRVDTWRATFPEGTTVDNQRTTMKKLYEELLKVDATTILGKERGKDDILWTEWSEYPESDAEFVDCYGPENHNPRRGRNEIKIEFKKQSSMNLAKTKSNSKFMAWLRSATVFVVELRYGSPRMYDMSTVLPMASVKATDKEELTVRVQRYLWEAATATEKDTLCPTQRKTPEAIDLQVVVRKIPRSFQADETRDCIAINTPREMARVVADIMEREDDEKDEANDEEFQYATNGVRLLRNTDERKYNMITQLMAHTEALYDVVQVGGYTKETFNVKLVDSGLTVFEHIAATDGVTRINARSKAYTSDKFTIHCKAAHKQSIECMVDDLNNALRTMKRLNMLTESQSAPHSEFLRVVPSVQRAPRGSMEERLVARGIILEPAVAQEDALYSPPRVNRPENTRQLPASAADRGLRHNYFPQLGRGPMPGRGSAQARGRAGPRGARPGRGDLMQGRGEGPGETFEQLVSRPNAWQGQATSDTSHDMSITPARSVQNQQSTNHNTTISLSPASATKDSRIIPVLENRLEQFMQSISSWVAQKIDEPMRAIEEMKKKHEIQSKISASEREAANKRERIAQERSDKQFALLIQMNQGTNEQLERLTQHIMQPQRHTQNNDSEATSPRRKKQTTTDPTMATQSQGSAQIFSETAEQLTQSQSFATANSFEALQEDDDDDEDEAAHDKHLLVKQPGKQASTWHTDKTKAMIRKIGQEDGWNSEDIVFDDAHEGTSAQAQERHSNMATTTDQRSPVDKSSRSGKQRL